MENFFFEAIPLTDDDLDAIQEEEPQQAPRFEIHRDRILAEEKLRQSQKSKQNFAASEYSKNPQVDSVKHVKFSEKPVDVISASRTANYGNPRRITALLQQVNLDDKDKENQPDNAAIPVKNPLEPKLNSTLIIENKLKMLKQKHFDKKKVSPSTKSSAVAAKKALDKKPNENVYTNLIPLGDKNQESKAIRQKRLVKMQMDKNYVESRKWKPDIMDLYLVPVLFDSYFTDMTRRSSNQ